MDRGELVRHLSDDSGAWLVRRQREHRARLLIGIALVVMLLIVVVK